MHDIDRRVGKFSISREEVFRNPDGVRAIMGRCIIVRCEMLYYSDGFAYMAMSPDFSVVKEGYWLPEYRVNVEDGIVTWAKIGDSSSPLEKA